MAARGRLSIRGVGLTSACMGGTWATRVGQLQRLRGIHRGAVRRYPFRRVGVLGVAGGNGLDLIDPRATDAVFGYDINPDYLAACDDRYRDDFGDRLHLIEATVRGHPRARERGSKVAIERYGAIVIRIDGEYEHSVARAKKTPASTDGSAQQHLLGRLQQADPEIRDARLHGHGRRSTDAATRDRPVTHVVMQGGVGNIPAAIFLGFASRRPGPTPSHRRTSRGGLSVPDSRQRTPTPCPARYGR